ncbi:PCRF domain-containing protein [bacterium]|nr:PCRF domain-containing protein [bacterium]
MSTSPENKKSNALIVEIRAGAGGEEAALFAADLFRMYSNYAKSQGWKQKILDSHPTSLGGLKQIVFELKGENVWEKMKYEAGVHRVQRIPKTEKGGRIHTSTASVAILLKPTETEIKIRPEELKIDYYRASGPGGQYVNRRETAVRITHLPTGLVVTSQTERNQLENKENALSILKARLLEIEKRKTQEQIAGARKSQIGSADRAEKIRTYNFPQDRITDHRIQKSWHNIDKILDGNLDPIIKKLSKILK